MAYDACTVQFFENVSTPPRRTNGTNDADVVLNSMRTDVDPRCLTRVAFSGRWGGGGRVERRRQSAFRPAARQPGRMVFGEPVAYEPQQGQDATNRVQQPFVQLDTLPDGGQYVVHGLSKLRHSVVHALQQLQPVQLVGHDRPAPSGRRPEPAATAAVVVELLPASGTTHHNMERRHRGRTVERRRLFRETFELQETADTLL